MKQDYFSVAGEPALHPDGVREKSQADPAAAGEAVSESESIRDSVLGEPGFAGSEGNLLYREWLLRRTAAAGTGRVVAATLLAGLLGGLFSIPGAFLAGAQTSFQGLYVVLFAPVIEEFMKQSGMIYLLEKKPYLLRWRWQFPAAALLASLIFAVTENLLYRHVYLAALPAAKLAAVMAFRWQYCTLLHTGCALIASAGMAYAWRRHRQRLAPAELGDAFSGLTAAIAVHALYNLLAVLGLTERLI